MPPPSALPPAPATDSAAPQLDYARDPRHPLHRYRRHILLALILAALAPLATHYGPRLWRHADALLAQSRLDAYLAPEDLVIVEQVEQPSLQRHPAPGSHAYAWNTHPAKQWSRVAARPPYVDATTFYLGPRHAPGGPTRLMHAFLGGSYTTLPTPGPAADVGFGIIIDVYEPATLTRSARRTNRTTGLGFGIPGGKRLAIHAAHPDPTDPARALVHYTSDLGGGTLRLTLIPADIVTLEILDGPAVPVAARPIGNLP